MPVSRRQQVFDACLHLFASVFDLATNRTAQICGGGGSDVTMTSSSYTTQGSRAAVVVHSTAAVSGSRSSSPEYFVIRCETVGCADFTSPDSAQVWTQRFGVRLQLGCVTSSVTWQMFCVDGRWQGPDTDCSPPGGTS